MDEQNNLTEVVETKNIVKTVTGADADGVAVDVNSLVSMNMWGLNTMRYLPPKDTAGFAGFSVSAYKREPRPPARIIARISLSAIMLTERK